MANHTTADDYTKYRSEKEVKAWELKDPILRLKLYMKKTKLWNDNKEEELNKKITKEVEAAVKKAQSVKPAPKEDIFKYMYEKPTKELQNG